MESYEVQVGGETFAVKPVHNICAHDIKRYRIHGGKSIPLVKNSDQTKMEQGEVFAIENFGTTGRGKVCDDVSGIPGPRLPVLAGSDRMNQIGIYGYGLRHDGPRQVALPFASANRLHKVIKDHFGSLVFCCRYLDRLGLERYLAGVSFCAASIG